MALSQCQLGALVRLRALVACPGAHEPPCAHISVACRARRQGALRRRVLIFHVPLAAALAFVGGGNVV